MDVKFKLFEDAKFLTPTYSTTGAAGADLKATETVEIKPGHRQLIKTGVGIELPEGYAAFVFGRSGNTIKRGLVVELGLIDSDYRGEIGAMAFNLSNKPVKVTRGDRVAQMVILNTPTINFVKVDKLTDTERGNGGYGSTGR